MECINRLDDNKFLREVIQGIKYISWLVFPFIVLTIGNIIDTTNNNIDSFLWLLVSFITTILVLPIYQKFYMSNDFKIKFDNNTLIQAFIGLLVLIVGLHLFGYLNNFENSSNQNQLEKIWSANSNLLHIYVIETGFFTPIIEELFFRAFLYIIIFKASKEIISVFNKELNTKKSQMIINTTFILVSAILFANSHLTDSFLTLIPYLYSGFLLGIIYVVTKNLLVPILIHSLNNIIVFLNFNTKEIYLFILIIIVVIIANQFILWINKK